MRRSTLLSFCAAALLGGLSLSGTALGNWFGDNAFDYSFGYSWGPGCPHGADIEGNYQNAFSDAMATIDIRYPAPMRLDEVEGESKLSTWCKTRITLAMSPGGTMGDMVASYELKEYIASGGGTYTVETTVDPGTLDLLGSDRTMSFSYPIDLPSYPPYEGKPTFGYHKFEEVGNIGAPSCHFYRYATFTVTTKLTFEPNITDAYDDAHVEIENATLQFLPLKEHTNAVKCAPLFHSLW